MDALDTLLIMGMKEEFDKGREWVATNLDMSTMVSIACKVTRRGVKKRCLSWLTNSGLVLNSVADSVSGIRCLFDPWIRP